MVADEQDIAVGQAERRHAVVPAGQPGAVVQHDRELVVVEGAVLESGGQPQPHRTIPQIRDRPQLAVARPTGVGGGGASDESLERAAQRCAAGRHRRTS